MLTDFTLSHLGLDLHAMHWAPTAAANGYAIAFVHGLGEHAGRYAHLARYYTAYGYHCFAFDHQGHGKSGGARGVIQDWPSLVSEINTLRAAMAGYSAEASQVILWGHSMGALATLSYLVDRPEAASLAGAVLTGIPLQLAFAPSPVLVKLASVLGKIMPNVAKSNELDAKQLSTDPAVVQAYLADPLVHDRLSMRLGHQMLSVAERLSTKRVALSVPTLVMHGTDDGISHVDGSRAFAHSATGDVTLRVWDALRHEIHNEPEQDEVFAFAKTWLDEHIVNPST